MSGVGGAGSRIRSRFSNAGRCRTGRNCCSRGWTGAVGRPIWKRSRGGRGARSLLLCTVRVAKRSAPLSCCISSCAAPAQGGTDARRPLHCNQSMTTSCGTDIGPTMQGSDQNEQNIRTTWERTLSDTQHKRIDVQHIGGLCTRHKRNKEASCA